MIQSVSQSVISTSKQTACRCNWFTKKPQRTYKNHR